MNKKAYAVIDMGFGDCGKGTTVECLCHKHKPDFVIRFNGGSQAAHNVHLIDGHKHTFSQFGSGTFQKIPTYLTQYVSIDPISLYREGISLIDYMKYNVFSNMHIHERCLITTPYHRGVNRLKENKRGDSRHGSCGVGYGETVSLELTNPELVLRYSDLSSRVKIREKLNNIKKFYLRDYADLVNSIEYNLDIEDIVDIYQNVYHDCNLISDDKEKGILSSSCVVWEGAQGLLLDENYGFYPNNTWSTVGRTNIDALYNKYNLNVHLDIIGVLRTYQTRHGYGVFVTENDECNYLVSDDDNNQNIWQGIFRVGYLDIELLKHANNICKVDYFVLTHFDKFKNYNTVRVCESYEYDFEHPFCKIDYDTKMSLNEQYNVTTRLSNVRPIYKDVPVSSFIDYVSNILNVECMMISNGKTVKDKIYMV